MTETVEVKVEIPRKLYEFILKKIEEELFDSVEDYILYSVRLLSELYGFQGVSILDKIVEKVLMRKGVKPSELSELEQWVLDTFGKSKFLFLDEYYSLILKDAMLRNVKPPSKEEFYKAIDKLVEKGYLEKIERDKDIIIRRKED